MKKLHTHLSSILKWIVSNSCKMSLTTDCRCNVSFFPVSLRTATTWSCFISFGPNSIRIGTPCKEVVWLITGGIKIH
jgi:hypothetical protein